MREPHYGNLYSPQGLGFSDEVFFQLILMFPILWVLDIILVVLSIRERKELTTLHTVLMFLWILIPMVLSESFREFPQIFFSN